MNNTLHITGKLLGIVKIQAYFLDTGIRLSRSLTGVILNGIMNIIIGIGVTIQLMFASFLYIPAFILLLPYIALAIGNTLITILLSTVLKIKLNVQK